MLASNFVHQFLTRNYYVPHWRVMLMATEILRYSILQLEFLIAPALCKHPKKSPKWKISELRQNQYLRVSTKLSQTIPTLFRESEHILFWHTTKLSNLVILKQLSVHGFDPNRNKSSRIPGTSIRLRYVIKNHEHYQATVKNFHTRMLSQNKDLDSCTCETRFEKLKNEPIIYKILLSKCL